MPSASPSTYCDRATLATVNLPLPLPRPSTSLFLSRDRQPPSSSPATVNLPLPLPRPSSSSLRSSQLRTTTLEALLSPESGHSTPSSMTMEDDSIDQATSARRERLRALRAAKEYASMPDVDGNANQNYGSKAELGTDGPEEKITVTFEGHSAEQAAVSQRETLMALRSSRDLLSTNDAGLKNSNGKVEDSDEAEENKEPIPKFKNYLPHDKRLQEAKLKPFDLPKFEDPVAPVQKPSENTENPFVNIAPKKPNWDLRRDVQKRLDKLERRTQKALYELMLEQEKEKAAMELDNAGSED